MKYQHWIGMNFRAGLHLYYLPIPNSISPERVSGVPFRNEQQTRYRPEQWQATPLITLRSNNWSVVLTGLNLRLICSWSSSWKTGVVLAPNLAAHTCLRARCQANIFDSRQDVSAPSERGRIGLRGGWRENDEKVIRGLNFITNWLPLLIKVWAFWRKKFVCWGSDNWLVSVSSWL